LSEILFEYLTVLRRAVAVNELIAPKDKLSRDPLFGALFHQADSTQAAISMASAFDVCLSLEGVCAFRKELRRMIGNQSFRLPDVGPEKLSWGSWRGGEDNSFGGGHEGGRSGCGGVCSSY
jgi:hypothetical protein